MSMKKICFATPCIILIILLLTSCDPLLGQRPNNYPNTVWVSQEPDMFFIVGEAHTIGRWGVPFAEIEYAQIVKNNEIIELLCGLGSGSAIHFYDPSGYDPETGMLLDGISTGDTLLFTGLCKFGKYKLVVTVDINRKGFLDDSITEIIFIREDISE